ncbi:hypothetical protein N7461_008452 [Penicillium sp. DV-2018c]|nr:hypothetical protein N7461_008452 [Penicillium sp. DV-2018c]
MARPENKPAATAIKLPTLKNTVQTTPSLHRSNTSNNIPQQKEAPPANYCTDADEQARACQHQIKATLTDILNDDRVRHNPDGSRNVQKILLENEHEIRKQRRHSLSHSTAKRQMML